MNQEFEFINLWQGVLLLLIGVGTVSPRVAFGFALAIAIIGNGAGWWRELGWIL